MHMHGLHSTCPEPKQILVSRQGRNFAFASRSDEKLGGESRTRRVASYSSDRLRRSLHIASSQRGHDWRNWKEQQGRGWRGERWKDPNKLRFEAKKQLFKPTAAIPVLTGLVVASMFGPLVLTIAASAFGLLFATVAGMTAMALFLPAAVFIGGSLAAFSVLGSIFSLLGLVPLVAFGWTVYNKSGRAKVEAARKEADVRRDEWQAKEYRRQQEELQTVQTEAEELEDFDRRLRSR